MMRLNLPQVGGNISLGDKVKYDKGLALMGGTASFGWAILTFTEVSHRYASGYAT
jgi:hypothetical protein